MKIWFCFVAFVLSALHSKAQDYPFSKDFKAGYLVMKDSTKREGELRWFGSQTVKLQFRKHALSPTEKFSPEDILSFHVDTFHFETLHDVKLFASNYPLLGITDNLKHVFARNLTQGKINVYAILFSDISAQGTVFPNFVFQNNSSPDKGYYALPLYTSMGRKKLEKIKLPLRTLFKEHPALLTKLETLNKDFTSWGLVTFIMEMNTSPK